MLVAMFSCLVELFPGVSTRPRTNLCTVEKCVLTVSSMAVQSLTHVWLLATPWTAGHQALLSFTSSGSLSKFTSIESVTLSNHLILCQPFLLLPSIFPSIRDGYGENARKIGLISICFWVHRAILHSWCDISVLLALWQSCWDATVAMILMCSLLQLWG